MVPSSDFPFMVSFAEKVQRPIRGRNDDVTESFWPIRGRNDDVTGSFWR